MEPQLYKISPKIKEMLLYKSPSIQTPFNNNIQIVFADVIASGRPCPLIENFINEKILPYYSNTHSNAYCGIKMKNLVNETKEYIRNCLHADKSKKIIFTGSGSTCAINHLIYCLKLEDIPKVNIFISTYEHHSNYLPWIEMSKRSKNITINIIPPNDSFTIDTNFIENKIKETQKGTVNIVAITACSNVIGVRIDTKKIYEMLQKYNDCSCCYGKRNLLFIDNACNAPYDDIDAKYADALFISPHKFLGGIGTPGILIANKELFHNQSPFIPGGGCVKKVCSKFIEYEKDVEKREMAGTPNIVGIIKIRKILELKSIFKNIIENNEKIIAKYVYQKFREMKNKYSTLTLVLPEIDDNRLPIVCMAIQGVHYNFIVALLSDLFGIQTRGGVSCTGILAELIKKRYGITGWCRISFNWLMDLEEINYILNSVEYVIQKYSEYEKYYEYNDKENLYSYKK